ncbi:tyrosine-type recombinase/integrase [Actinomadura sp. NPDC047616]|uniref:tyrosine-type recombinase/integrase n=1 Tax=Actinomadura sp. NPDC047616 TaxID=3155914 RepID=UPI0033FBF7AE
MGDPLFPDTVTALMRKLINACNRPQDGKPRTDPLPLARLHDLRHIHATTLLLAGVPVHVVAVRLGHADPAITLRVYAHIVGAIEERTAEVFAKALKDAARDCPVSKAVNTEAPSEIGRGLWHAEPPVGIEPTTCSLREPLSEVRRRSLEFVSPRHPGFVNAGKPR